MGYVFCTLQAAHAAHSQNLSFVTACVTLIVKNPLIMTERNFDSINLPLFATALLRSACVKRRIPKEEKRRTFLFLWYIFLGKRFFAVRQRNG